MIKKSIFFASLASLVIWVFTGRQVLEKQFAQMTPEQLLDERIRNLAISDPKAAAELTRLKEKHDAKALTASIQVHENDQGISTSILSDALKQQTLTPRIELASYALNNNDIHHVQCFC